MLYDMNSEPGHAELLASVSHPISEYQQGSERLERLYQQIADANRFTQPEDLSFNL